MATCVSGFLLLFLCMATVTAKPTEDSLRDFIYVRKLLHEVQRQMHSLTANVEKLSAAFERHRENCEFRQDKDLECFKRTENAAFYANELTLKGISDPNKCLRECLSSRSVHGFLCKSITFYYDEDECILSTENKESFPDQFKSEIKGERVDYWDNNCDTEVTPEPFRCFTKSANRVLDADVTDAQTLQLVNCLELCLGNDNKPKCRSIMYFRSELVLNCILTDATRNTPGVKIREDSEPVDLYERIEPCPGGSVVSTTPPPSRCLPQQTPILVNGQPQTCFFLGVNEAVCNGGVCTQDQQNQFGGVCCSQIERCPAGQTQVRNVFDVKQIQTCFLRNQADAVCGTNGRCLPDPVNNHGNVCCQPDTPTGRCLNGGNPFGKPHFIVVCQLHQLGQACGGVNGYVCSRDSLVTTQGLCCSQGTGTNRCPNNANLLLVNGVARTCLMTQIGQTVCGQTGYSCQRDNQNANAGICCSTTIDNH